MMGEFVDEYTVRCVDVFAMPQSGTSVSVEAVDPVYQAKMTEMLKQVGRYVSPCDLSVSDVLCLLTLACHYCSPETVIGWYHSHPGFGCWLSAVDVNTQQACSQLKPASRSFSRAHETCAMWFDRALNNYRSELSLWSSTRSSP